VHDDRPGLLVELHALDHDPSPVHPDQSLP
jgi:hypothetical protein